MQMPLSDTEVIQLWARHQSGGQLSAFEITRLFDTVFERAGRVEFVAKAARDYQNSLNELREYVESWIKDVAYSEDDFVLTQDSVIVLLDKIHPQWRSVFDKTEEPIFAKLSPSDLIAIKFIADGGVKNKDASVQLEEDD